MNGAGQAVKLTYREAVREAERSGVKAIAGVVGYLLGSKIAGAISNA